MALTDQEIRAIYDAGFEAVRDVIRALERRIENLEQRVATLEAVLAKNSRNSSKPPSTDTFHKVERTKSLRQRSGRVPGGQHGHEGATLPLVDNPDTVVTHAVCRCAACGRDIAEEKPVGYQRRQETDLPPVRPRVTEHRAETKRCSHCGMETTAEFPAHLSNQTQYGKGIQALAVYLTNYQLLPYERTQELFADVLGVRISHATLANICTRCAGLLQPVESWIREQIIRAPTAHFDETGVRVQKKTRWLHIASTALMTLYGVFDRRGKKGIEAMGILPFFKGTAVHDAWSAYFLFFCSHAMCNAHHLRELVFIAEQYGQRWATTMIRLLCDILEAVKSCRGAKLTPRQTARFERRYDAIIARGYQVNPRNRKPTGRRGRAKQTPALNLLDRLKRRKHETLTFMYDRAVPFDNNLAERDGRMMKVRQRISGCFRSIGGAQTFCRIRSFISTVRKHGRPVLHAIESALDGRPFQFLTEAG